MQEVASRHAALLRAPYASCRPSDLPRFRDHLLRLDAAEQARPLQRHADDNFVSAYADRCFAEGTTVIGYVEGDQVLGAAELHERPDDCRADRRDRLQRRAPASAPRHWRPPVRAPDRACAVARLYAAAGHHAPAERGDEGAGAQVQRVAVFEQARPSASSSSTPPAPVDFPQPPTLSGQRTSGTRARAGHAARAWRYARCAQRRRGDSRYLSLASWRTLDADGSLAAIRHRRLPCRRPSR